MHFFDYNATTPLGTAAKSAWLEAQEANWLNPSSPYRAAAAVKVRLDELQEQLGAMLAVEPERLVFNSGATEGNNMVLRHLDESLPDGARIGISPIEHPSVLEPAEQLFGDRIEWLPVGKEGRVRLEALDLSGLAAVSMMAANNETGVLQPWVELLRLCREHGIPFHCDASQWVGKMPLDGLGQCDFLTACGHKFGGPRGAGFLLVPREVQLSGRLLGGEQQAGRRAGTEDFAAVAAMLAALEAAEQGRSDCGPAGKNLLLTELKAQLPGFFVVGSQEASLWNTVSLCLPDFASVRWIRALEKRDFLLSAGSACSTGHAGPSQVLAAMGLSSTDADRVIRISSGWGTTAEDWQLLAKAILEAYSELKQSADDSQTGVISI